MLLLHIALVLWPAHLLCCCVFDLAHLVKRDFNFSEQYNARNIVNTVIIVLTIAAIASKFQVALLSYDMVMIL